MSTPHRLPRASLADHDARLVKLEEKTRGYDETAGQVKEMYDLFKAAKTINWFVWKIGAWIGGGLVLLGTILTIAANAKKLFVG